MGLSTKLFRNTSYLTIGNQIGNLLQFLFFVYFARQFGDKIVGQYSFAFSFAFLFSVVADLGLSPYIIREVARDESGTRQIFAQCLSARLVAIAFSALLAVMTIFVFRDNLSGNTINTIMLLGLFHIFFSVADIFLAELKGHDRMGLVAILTILLRFVIVAGGIFLMKLQFEFLVVLTCFPAAGFIYLVTCIYSSSRYFSNCKPQFKALNLGSLFTTLLPFAFTVLFVEALYHQDILMLGFLQDDRAVGIFSPAYTIILAILGVLAFVHTALLPTFSRLYIESESTLIHISGQWLRYLVLVGLPAATGLFAISDRLVLLLFSDSFKYSGEVLKILSWAVALSFSATIYSVLLTAINRQTQKVIAVGACLALNVTLNILLIPTLSYKGAAIAKLMTEGLHLVLMAYLVSKYLTSLSLHKILLKPALSCLLMYSFVRLFDQWNLIFVVLICVLVYLLSLVVLRGYTKEEIELIKYLFFQKLLRTKGSLEA